MTDPEILDPIDVRPRSSGERMLVHVLYGMHTAAWLSLGTLAVIALIVNYIRRADDPDPLYILHHRYMITTFWWTVVWLLLTAPLPRGYLLACKLAGGAFLSVLQALAYMIIVVVWKNVEILVPMPVRYMW
jgi:uncharacterized membrane protein